jgi:hypothetical protein
MNLDESWIDASRDISRNYVRKCPKCDQDISLLQTGDTIPESILDEIIKLVHIENFYDAFWKHIQVGGKWIKIDAEITQTPCKNL